MQPESMGLTSSCSSSLSSSLTTGLARDPRLGRRRPPLSRSCAFSLRPSLIFTFTERAAGAEEPGRGKGRGEVRLGELHMPFPLAGPLGDGRLTLRLGAFLFALLLLFALFALAVVLFLDFLPHTGEHRLQHNGVFVDLWTGTGVGRAISPLDGRPTPCPLTNGTQWKAHASPTNLRTPNDRPRPHPLTNEYS